MNNTTLSFDQYRREIRRELFLKRQQDKDHSEARLFSDAQKLDAELIAAGYQLVYPTEWCRKRNLSLLEPDISDLNSKDEAELSRRFIKRNVNHGTES
jgi:hypothetical protein